jgi:transposase InsO family protein
MSQDIADTQFLVCRTSVMAQRVISVDVRLAIALSGQSAGRLNVTALCAELKISRQHFYVLRRRAREGGLQAVLEPRSRRPHRSPAQVPAALEDLIVLMRKELPDDGWDAGALSIWYRLPARMRQDRTLQGCPVPSRATIHRVLVRRGQVTPQPRKAPRSRHRFEYPNPNACWQVDGTEWPLADGTVACIVQVLDDNSRKLLAHNVEPSETIQNAWAAFCKAFERHGMPFQVLTDKGSAMIGRPEIVTQIRRNLRALGIHCITSRGNHPQTCGKNERVHQTLQQWLRAQPSAATIEQLQTLCDTFETAYNSERPHQALHGLTPDQRYHASPKLGPGAEIAPEPVLISHNLVSSRGVVVVGRWQVHVGRPWEGCDVLIVRQDLHAAIFHREQLIREVHIDPDKVYQPSGRTYAPGAGQKTRFNDLPCHRCPETCCQGCPET